MASKYLAFEDLSPEEQSAVKQLQTRLSGRMDPEMFDDLSVFVRFLRARDLNVNAADVMLRNHIEWRKTNQLDTILTNYVPKEVCAKFIAITTIGLDKAGSPIIYLPIGKVDFKGLLKSCRKSDIIKFIVLGFEKNLELMKKESEKREEHIDQWIALINCEDFSFASATHKQTIDVFAKLILTYDANYPERLKAAYFVNASVYFTMFYSVIKHLISGPTLKKINIFGKEGWKEEILKLVDPEVLPEFLGGKRTDPDGNPLCKSFIHHGGNVPETYFITKKESNLIHSPGVKKLTVTRRAKNQLTYNVTESGSYIEWEFETKSRDIAFSLHYKKDDSETWAQELIPKQRIDTNLCSEMGMFKCEAPGIYILEFDNMYSWLHQKEIYYRVSVSTDPLIK